MSVYRRRVQYYETDRMGITHHANYLHIMEEARIAFMDGMGYPYRRLEDEGVFSPVTSVSCRYLAPTTFGDEITVETVIESFNGVVLKLAYTIRDPAGKTVFTAVSEHTFLDRQGHFVRLKRDHPEFYRLLAAQVPPAEK